MNKLIFPFIICWLILPVATFPQAKFENDIGVIEIIEPYHGHIVGNEVIIRIFNFGTQSQSGFMVSYQLDTLSVVYDTVFDIVHPGNYMIFTFSEQLEYGIEIQCCTHLISDQNPENNCIEKKILRTMCVGYYTGCSDGDGFTDFALEEIENYNSECEDNAGVGWSQYPELGPAIVEPGETYQVSMSSGYNSNNASIWIDINNNDEYWDNEMILFDFLMETAGYLYTVDLQIPDTIPEGLHFFRARTNFVASCYHP